MRLRGEGALCISDSNCYGNLQSCAFGTHGKRVDLGGIQPADDQYFVLLVSYMATLTKVHPASRCQRRRSTRKRKQPRRWRLPEYARILEVHCIGSGP